ncbi:MULTISPECIES: DUF3769 domain-containing protein [unclassified Leptolyngbya]|uniref:DUF3769 domain-containing protein n=1 Tax=unclassified Leptolyngbya TaxID=2650499 RepID=UPI001686C6CF|nr:MULTISPECIES: DUF3769 domain-containing protein [unclassified Leptolyngbya]MBD1910377.1 DUF3769 domain-containing protein [Leptolyngbya sp. FACHB-8]MBD2155305.1 DUF3769 domain-containing protein [Leptolyngbya sp. FACHB-16]
MPHSVPPPAPPPIVHVLSPETANKAFTAAHQPAAPDTPIQDPLVVERVHVPEPSAPASAVSSAPAETPAAPRPRYDRPDTPRTVAIAPEIAALDKSTNTPSARARYRRPEAVDAAIAPEVAAPEASTSGDRLRSHHGQEAANASVVAPAAPVIPEAPSEPDATVLNEPPPRRRDNRAEAVPALATSTENPVDIASSQSQSVPRQFGSGPIPSLYSEAGAPAPGEPVPAEEASPRQRPVFRRRESYPIPPLYSEQANLAGDRSRASELGGPIGISLDDLFPVAPPPEISVGVTPIAAPRQESLGEEQVVSLAGSTVLLPMLQELQQLSGATIVAQSRQDVSQRQILTIPEEDEPGSAETGIPEDLQVPDDETSDTETQEPSPDDSETVSPDGVDDSPEGNASEENTAPDTDNAENEDSDPTAASPTGEATDEVTVALPPDVLEIDSDYLDYDTLREVFYAEGNVEMRFRQAVLTADRMRINMSNRQAVAEGNVVFTRGDQILLGNRLDYNIVQGAGNVTGVRGEVYLPTSGQDLTILPNDVGAQALPSRPLSGTITQGQPDNPVAGQGGIQIGVGTAGRGSGALGLGQFGGEIRRFRFEADTAEFYPNGWTATNVRLTNDPFSPPELELRSPYVTYTRLSPLRAEIRARNPQVVFDQNFRLPLFQDRIIISSERRNNTPLAQIGYDDNLGGFFLERPINLISTSRANFSISPLILVQRAVEDNGFNIFDPSSLGLTTRLDYEFGPQTILTWRAVLESLAFDNLEEQVRTSLRLRQGIGNHQLSLEYAYRNRFFNGSLGFQEVDSSLGFVLTSPNFVLGDSRINLSYQAGAQYIRANTDRDDLIESRRRIAPVRLYRAQGSVALSRGFSLWQGRPLPSTRDQGLRFTSVPVVPFLRLVGSARGVFSAYSSDDTQATLTGSLSLRGQFGHFARNTLDYTAFNVTFSETLGEGESPFRFDRAVDRTVLSLGFLQQIYGPFRFGVQASFNLDRSDPIDTVYTLEYSRRTYSITLRYSPIRESGSLSLQINEFDWNNLRDPFSGPTGAVTVESGVPLSND